MSKTITITSAHPETPRQRTIDVAKFAAFSAEFNNPFADHPPEVVHYLALGLVTYDGGLTNRYRVTPRGEDLLASAHLIPDDPKPEQPSATPCEACNGTGEQTLLVSTHVCDVCQGSKVAPRRGHASLNVPRFFEFTDDEKAALRRYAKTTPFDDGQVRYSMALSVESDGTRVKTEHLPDGRTLRLRDNGAGWVVESVTQPEPEAANPWVLIDSEAVARSFVGKRVEIDAPSTSRLPAHALHDKVLTLCDANDRELLFDRGVPGVMGCIAWSTRGNIRLRVVGGYDV